MKSILFLGLTALTLIFTSCSTEAAQGAADELHQSMDSGNFDYICDHLLDEEALIASPRDVWMDLFKTIQSWGKIENREKRSGFSRKYDNGISTVKLKYKFDIEGTPFYESVVFVDRGDAGLKLLAFSVHQNEAEADEYTKEY